MVDTTGFFPERYGCADWVATLYLMFHPVCFLIKKCCRYNLRCISIFFATGLFLPNQAPCPIKVAFNYKCDSRLDLSLLFISHYGKSQIYQHSTVCTLVSSCAFRIPACMSISWVYFILFLCYLILLPSLVYSTAVSMCFLVGY